MREKPEFVRRALEYAQRGNLTLSHSLGYGVHGIVWAAKNQDRTGQTAIKIHEREPDYLRERNVYLRLQAKSVTKIRSCWVPELADYDDELRAIEMTVVERPFVLDFGGAYLDKPPEFSEEVMADWWAEKQEQFGGRWPEAAAILRVLETYGIFVIDVNPGNIALSEEGG